MNACPLCANPKRRDHRCPAYRESRPSLYKVQCGDCSFALDNRGIEGTDTLMGYRYDMNRVSYEHVRDTGHTVHVAMTCNWVLVPHSDTPKATR